MLEYTRAIERVRGGRVVCVKFSCASSSRLDAEQALRDERIADGAAIDRRGLIVRQQVVLPEVPLLANGFSSRGDGRQKLIAFGGRKRRNAITEERDNGSNAITGQNFLLTRSDPINDSMK